jgi:hypothetical protein
MIDRDLIEIVVALGIIATCAALVMVSTSPARERPPAAPRVERRRRREPASPSATDPPSPANEVPRAPLAQPPAGRRARPRILTGEPASPERARPATRRALKLVVGITVLAAAGALGLLAIVRALVAMFEKIG